MQGYAVSTTELRLKATNLANTSNFRGSISWSYAFLKRHSVSIRLINGSVQDDQCECGYMIS